MRRPEQVLHLGFIEKAAPRFRGCAGLRIAKLILPMKKVILSAALLCGVSFASMAAVTTNAKLTTPQKSLVKVEKIQDLYCQSVQFRTTLVQICGETFSEYVDCLNEAKIIFG